MLKFILCAGGGGGNLKVSNGTCTCCEICFVHTLLFHLAKLTVTFARKMHINIICNASHDKQLQFPNCHTCLKLPMEGSVFKLLYAKQTL